MRNIRILCIGKKQEAYLTSGVEIYEKKLKRYCHFEMTSLKEANYGKGSIKQWHQKEWKEIQNQFRPQTYVIACDEKGKLLSSTHFAEKLQKIANQGYSRIDFVIGGPYGLPQEIRTQSDMILSVSPMTMTHQMVRLFLAEQIYRAFTIMKGEKYHH